MFRQRLLTALILVPLVLIAIYYASYTVLSTIILAIIALLGWEWLQLIPIKNNIGRCVYIATLLLLVWPATLWLNNWLIVDLIFWGLIFVAVVTFPASQAVWGHPAVVGSSCLLLLPVVASSISALYQETNGKDYIVYLLCLIWAADIGAYLAGKQWGCHKLIPAVSPGKTIEGTIGGIGLVLIVATVGYLYFHPNNMLSWVVISLGTGLISMLGDLFNKK